MELIATRNKGAEDILPSKTHMWQTVEKVAAETAETYGFKEIRIPTFEKTELFVRSVGETTDVVQKEMFTVTGKESSFTLRPEGTAGVIRAILQNGMLNDALPQKVFYLISCFRHENVQKGRLWEFHQFGAEMCGSPSPAADAEMICFAKTVLDRLGLDKTELHINSIGCPSCRREYYNKLRDFLAPNKEKLCSTCQSRFDKNPMRILDCKSEICREIGKDAPLMIDYLCDDCREHFEKLKALLEGMGISYTIDPKIVRGLDYYTKTVFEFISHSIGAQGTICGGGRYDGMIEEMGGNPTPALGFAMGIERILLAMQSENCSFIEPKYCDIYIGSMGQSAQVKAASLVKELRDVGFRAESDVMDRGVKAQMKYANKLSAAFSMIIGDNELSEGKARLKNMRTGEELPMLLDKSFADVFSDIRTADMLASEL